MAALAALALGLSLGARRLGGTSGPRGSFRDVTREAGLAFTYDNDARGAHRFIESTGGGCAFVDTNNDGLLDIVAVQGGPAPGSAPRARPRHALYVNRGNGTFVDGVPAAGLGIDTGYAQGVSAADYDGDGWTDILITSYGGTHLFRNRRGSFHDVTTAAGLRLPGEPHWATSAAWADYDRDGHLDLFVCHYASWFPDVERPCVDSARRPMYCAPTAYPGDVSVLYRSRGDGTFENSTARAGLAELEGKALGAAWLDFDQDGWQDLFIANDMTPNRLLRNDRTGRFRDVAPAAGVANGPTGQPLSGMGVSAADFDGDAREDLIVVNFSRQPRSYFLNLGDGNFNWGSEWAGLGGADQPFLAFGVDHLDYDLDGDPDLVAGNGHLNQAVERVPGGVTYRQRQQLFRNLGDGRFVDDRQAAGDLSRERITRGLAVGDYDNDGRADVVVSGPGSPLELYRNVSASRAKWIGFRLEGKGRNTEAIGARVCVRAGGRAQWQVVRSGSSYCSRSDTRLLFGLGAHDRVDAVEVEWPRGRRQRVSDLIAGRYYLLREAGACVPDPRVYRGGEHGEP